MDSKEGESAEGCESSVQSFLFFWSQGKVGAGNTEVGAVRACWILEGGELSDQEANSMRRKIGKGSVGEGRMWLGGEMGYLHVWDSTSKLQSEAGGSER
jgi:hypothetical protein